MRQGNLFALTDANLIAHGIEQVQNKRGRCRIIRWSWALRMDVAVAQSLRKIEDLPAGVASVLPLFPSRYGIQPTRAGFKTAWHLAMKSCIAAGGKRLTEHDIRAKSGSDVDTDQRAADLLGNTVKTARTHYRRAPAKVCGRCGEMAGKKQE